MRRCPKCNREYEDELRFCLEDGTPLTREGLTPTVAAPTAVFPVAHDQPSTVSSAGRPDIPPIENELKPAFPHPAPPSGSALPARIVGGALLLLIVIANVVGMFFWGWMFARRLPLTLAFMAVMLLAMVRAPRHPKVSLLAVIALGFDLLETFVYIILTRTLQASLYQGLAIADSIVAAAVIVLLTMAVMSERAPQQPLTN